MTADPSSRSISANALNWMFARSPLQAQNRVFLPRPDLSKNSANRLVVGQLQRDIKDSSSHPSQMSEVTLRFYIVNFKSYLSVVAADRVIC
jgi:hypothetical protein